MPVPAPVAAQQLAAAHARPCCVGCSAASDGDTALARAASKSHGVLDVAGVRGSSRSMGHCVAFSNLGHGEGVQRCAGCNKGLRAECATRSRG